MDLDRVDLNLVEQLQRNARASNQELARNAHVAPSTSSERIKGLIAEGVVTGFHAEVSPAALGRDLQALTAIAIQPPTRGNVEGFRDWATELPEVVGIFVVSGGSDFLLHIAVADTDALYAFVVDRLTTRDEVAKVDTSIIYEYRRKKVVSPTAEPRR